MCMDIVWKILHRLILWSFMTNFKFRQKRGYCITFAERLGTIKLPLCHWFYNVSLLSVLLLYACFLHILIHHSTMSQFSQLSKWWNILPQTRLNPTRNSILEWSRLVWPITRSLWNWVKLPCASVSAICLDPCKIFEFIYFFLPKSKRTTTKHMTRWWTAQTALKNGRFFQGLQITLVMKISLRQVIDYDLLNWIWQRLCSGEF